MYRIVFVFFFFSGFSSLVFEVIWSRMLRQVFGTTSFAISTLLAAFMAGLALGSYLGGKYADRFHSQLRVYGLLEGAIGAYALAVPVFLDYLPVLYGLLFAHFIEDFLLFSLLRFAAVFAILLVPTTLMGATLPLVSQWIAERRKMFQGNIGVLYGANTFGACIGCLLAGFVLLPILGLSATNTMFATVNFALCAVVLLICRRIDASPTAVDETGHQPFQLHDDELADVVGVSARPAAHPRWALYCVVIAFGLTGAVAMAYQVLWTRTYLIALGSSTYSFTLVLTAVLVGIALGSATLSPFVKRIRRPLFWFACIQLSATAAAALSFLTIDRIPRWLYEYVQQAAGGPTEIYVGQFALVAAVVFLPSFLQGMSFPVVVRAVTDRPEETGSDVGNAYAYNTTGAIVGSFLAGFVLLPWLGLESAIMAVVGLNFAVAVGLAGVEMTLHPGVRQASILGCLGVATLGLLAVVGPVDRAQLTSGAFRAEMVEGLLPDDGFESYDPEILHYEDGLTATTSVERHGEHLTLKANGKPEASDASDMPRQIMVGLLPLVVRSGFDDIDPGDEHLAMIGYGSGVTAGASLQWPVEQLDVVEIESTMIEASRHFDHVNNRPLDDPRLNLIESDGRNFLEYTSRTYDVIISEPSNPWVAGVSSLFTREFFERARQRLRPGGVYGQWVQLYEMHPDNVRSVFATFRSVFEYVHVFSSGPKSADVILVGSDRPFRLPPDGYQRAWNIDSVAHELQRAGIESAHQLYGLLFMNPSQQKDFAAGTELNTDDNGLLEFSTPLDMLFPEAATDFFTEWYYDVEDSGDPRPHLEAWPEAWSAEQIGALAHSLWIAGKPALAADVVDDADISPTDTRAMKQQLDDVRRVLDVSKFDRLDIVAEYWPATDTELHKRAPLAAKSAQLRQRDLDRLNNATQLAPELALYHALLLAEQRDYRRAERRLDDLAESTTLNDEPVFHFLRADVLEVRRRYDEAFTGYRNFADLTGH